jgi:hypothetical protein
VMQDADAPRHQQQQQQQQEQQQADMSAGAMRRRRQEFLEEMQVRGLVWTCGWGTRCMNGGQGLRIQ